MNAASASWATPTSLYQLISKKGATIMSQKLLQVNFNFSGVSRAELEEAWLPAARAIAETPGLRWKIFLMNEAECEVGGMCLFDDEASLQTYLAGPVAALKNDPTLSNIRVKQFDVMEEHSAITRGPIHE